MQKQKKFAVMVLALMLMATQAGMASAETMSGKNDSKSIDVKARYVDGITEPEVYSVDITWGSMEFTYSAAGTHEWNPGTHKYTDNTSASWTADGNDVTVVNHSNKDVKVNFAYAADEGYSSIAGKFSVASDTLAAGVVGNVDGADSVSTKLTLSGTLASSASQFIKVGSIKVSLN